jgi:hypothetical protein
MAEQITLTTAETKPANPAYRVERMTFATGINPAAPTAARTGPFASIYIQVMGNNGEAISHSITGDAALTLLKALNKANLTTQSLERRVLQRLIDDGVLAGTLTGTPD